MSLQRPPAQWVRMFEPLKILGPSLFVLSLLHLACGGEVGLLDGGSTGESTTDGGALFDAGFDSDAGHDSDAGASSDSGTLADGGTKVDAGTKPDGGSNVDAGTKPDSGTKPDAGPKPDAGTGIPDPVFAKPPTPSYFASSLTCHAPWAQALSSDVQVGMIGSDVTSVVGVNQQFAGIGAKFQLLNNKSQGNWVDVLEPRSGAGAGWQTSMLVKDWPGGVGIIVFNQGAGNSTADQWGYANTFSENGQNIHSLGWNPVYSDHIHAVAGAHSPCIPNGYIFDDGAVNILGAKVATPHGTALVWKNQYRYKSRIQQQWPSVSVEQAFYLSRSVARMGNLRLYLRRGATKHGPFKPYDSFSIPSATCDQVNGSHCNTLAYDYAVLVWNIFGLDIGIAIPDLNAVSMNLETRTYCGNAANDACGNLNFHSWVRNGGADSIAPGEIRTYSQLYYVGTLPQLADLGYSTW